MCVVCKSKYHTHTHTHTQRDTPHTQRETPHTQTHHTQTHTHTRTHTHRDTTHTDTHTPHTHTHTERDTTIPHKLFLLEVHLCTAYNHWSWVRTRIMTLTINTNNEISDTLKYKSKQWRKLST